MTYVSSLGLALLLSSSVQAADPPRDPVKPDATATPTTAGTAPRAAGKPLNLRIGDVRKYMMPNEFRAALNPSEADRNTIVVEGDLPAPPLKSTQPLPQGLGAVFSLFQNPLGGWRMFLPDPHGVPPGPPDPVPKREFRWGP